MKRPVYTVYRTTNLLNNCMYIGVHKTLDPNDGYLGSGKIIKQAIEKDGKENFKKEVLFIYKNLTEAYEKEKELVNQDYVMRIDTYNLATGGCISPDHTGDRSYPKGDKHHMWGKKASTESNLKRSQTLKKTNQKEETKKNRSEGGKKAALSSIQNGYIRKILQKGKKLSKEDKMKKSIAAKNREKVTCPFCNKSVDPGNAKLWHFKKCKFNNSNF